MDADRQIRISPYMGINGHRQTDGQNGSYDNRYNGVCIKGGTSTVFATQSEAQTDTEISIMGIKGQRQTDGGGDKHKTSNKECDWEDIDDADLNDCTAFAEENKDQ